MLRPFLAIIGVIELVAPRRLVDGFERITLHDPDPLRLRSWVVPAVRFEGLVYLLVAARGGGAYAGLKRALGVLGIPIAVAPRRYLDTCAGLVYDDPDACRWKGWMPIATRAIAIALVLAALADVRAGRRDEPKRLE